MGLSRKSMIWRLLDSSPQEALNGTTVLNTVALMKGANIIRVHDIKEAVETIKIIQKLIHTEEQEKRQKILARLPVRPGHPGGNYVSRSGGKGKSKK